MSQVIWVRGKALVYKCWYKEKSKLVVVPDLSFSFFLLTLDRVLLAQSMRNSVKIFLNYVQVLGLKLLKVLSSDITKWNSKINCLEARGVTSNGLWGLSWLTNSSLCSLTSFACFQPFLVIPQRDIHLFFWNQIGNFFL